MNTDTEKHNSSFRDPDGFIFLKDSILYRQINKSGQEDYDALMSSGLYKELIDKKSLVAHKESTEKHEASNSLYKIIEPQFIPFISYPYEWSFSQLKAAALLTLDIQKSALERNLSLKDASAYNIQFSEGKPIFIDTLSFEKYEEGKPWAAYRQFCQHFLIPLALMKHIGPEVSQMFRTNIDGIPLELGHKLLPFKTYFSFGLLVHVHLHFLFQAKNSTTTSESKNTKAIKKFTKFNFLALLDSLRSLILKLDLKIEKSTWNKYYGETNYSDSAMTAKEQLVSDFAKEVDPKIVWDMGGNTGRFSRLLANSETNCICFDFDHWCVELNSREVFKNNENHVLPLVLDASNPSPALGWSNTERSSLTERGPCDLLLALALVHHISIANNIPLELVAKYFANLSKNLIIEFVPKVDSQVKRLLSAREDIFTNYNIEYFEQVFSDYFRIVRKEKVEGSERTLYLMTLK